MKPMTDEYIRKQDAIDTFNHAVQDVGILDADDIETVFGMLSSADVVQVVHGHWIDKNGNIIAPFWERYECSICGARSDNSNFCPNCGAKMDGEECGHVV